MKDKTEQLMMTNWEERLVQQRVELHSTETSQAGGMG